jgi:hypothetical protein
VTPAHTIALWRLTEIARQRGELGALALAAMVVVVRPGRVVRPRPRLRGVPAHTVAVVRAALDLNKCLAYALADLYDLPSPAFAPGSSYARLRAFHASLCPCQSDEDPPGHLSTCPWGEQAFVAGGFLR